VIAVTQPRRVAATSLAARVAAERHVLLGTLVGYSVRFDEASSQQTRIKYLTDGMIIRELLFNPLLSQYSVIVVDEAHERTLRTDLLLSNLKRIQQSRESKNPLKIVIMSATLDAEKVSTFFNGYFFLLLQIQLLVTIFSVPKSFTSKVDNILSAFFIRLKVNQTISMPH
jgi:HrpA-like RNA helicase